MRKDLSNGTFCVLPFIEEFISLDGNKYLCCMGETHAPVREGYHVEQLKEKIANGERVEQCTACYDIEDKGGISPRFRETKRWMVDPDVKFYINNWQPYDTEPKYFYDIRYDNKCNLACITCKPDNSSLWQKELGIPVGHRQIDINLTEILNSKKIYLAGGEPLIIDEFITLLGVIADSKVQPEVVINTNLTRVNDSIKAVLNRITNLTLTISVDAYGDVNEYHRYPLKWSKFTTNLEWAKTLNCTLMFNSVIDAVSVLNMHELIELEDGIDFWTLSFVIARKKLQVENIPHQYKTNTINQFEKIKQSKFYVDGSEFKANVDSTLRQIMLEGEPELLSAFIHELDERRNINHRDYLGIQLCDIL